MKDKIIYFILLLATFIRLITLTKLLVFTPDEEYLLYITQTLIKNFHIIWVGVSALGFDFYMGPLWIYFIYPFVAIGGGDPIVLGIITSILGVFTTYLLYFLGNKMFNIQAGIIASSLYATSPLIIYYDQQPYPPGVPFLSLLILLSLYMTKHSGRWWILFSICYGLVFNIHLSLTLTIFVAFYYAFVNRKLLTRKIFVLAILSFLITISPLIAFDYFHKASNITAPIRVLQTSKKNSSNFNIISRLHATTSSFSRLFYLKPHSNNADEILHPCFKNQFSSTTTPFWIISLLVTLIILFFIFRLDVLRKYEQRLLLLLGLSVLLPFILSAFISPIEYYLLGFFPILFIIIGLVISQSYKPIRYLFYISILIFMINSMFTVFTATGDFGIQAKKSLIAQVMTVIKNDPYSLAEEGACHKYGGWRYLFSNYARRPENSTEDKTFSWLFPDEITNTSTKFRVVIVESRSQINLTQNYKMVLRSGGFEAYIYENQ